MDVRMPEVDGIRATERILAGTAEPPRIPVVTTFENDSHVYDALRAGAAGPRPGPRGSPSARRRCRA